MTINKIISIARIFHPNKIPTIARYLMRDEAISGKLIIIAAGLALLFANSPLLGFYNHIWLTHFTIGLNDWSISMDLKHWISEGLMAFFFLVVGLEIKREMVKGELRHVRTAILPIAAALGGMIIPAAIYILFNSDGTGFKGWAIPMATDIAFAIGALTLLGDRIPSSLKLFLLTLAIVDDIGAIIVIGLFYGAGFNFWMLGVAVLLALLLVILERQRRFNLTVFVLIGIALWLALYSSGVHASITGAVLGLLAPVFSYGRAGPSLAERLEKYMIPISTLFVVPLFVFANMGVGLSLGGFSGSAVSVAWGIAGGLIAGKVIGITGVSWILVKLGIGKLPEDISWVHIIGVGLLAGIGFTVSVFVTELAFVGNQQLVDVAKLSILSASVVSGILGLVVLKYLPRNGILPSK